MKDNQQTTHATYIPKTEATSHRNQNKTKTTSGEFRRLRRYQFRRSVKVYRVYQSAYSGDFLVLVAESRHVGLHLQKGSSHEKKEQPSSTVKRVTAYGAGGVSCNPCTAGVYPYRKSITILIRMTKQGWVSARETSCKVTRHFTADLISKANGLQDTKHPSGYVLI